MVIAIPNRDVLLITGSNDMQNVTKVVAIADKMFKENNYLIHHSFINEWTTNGKDGRCKANASLTRLLPKLHGY